MTDILAFDDGIQIATLVPIMALARAPVSSIHAISSRAIWQRAGNVPEAATAPQDSDRAKQVGVPETSRPGAPPAVGLNSGALDPGTHWQVIAATQEAGSAEKMAPAVEAREELKNRTGLANQPFGQVVSLIARGEPLPTQATPSDT
jgi:hypothetical protein